MEYVLSVNSVSKQYKKFKALNNLSMNVPKGAIYGLVGKNGAGKTTLIRIICGLQKPTEGGFTLYGYENTDRGINKARKRMGAVVETPSLYLDMTARDNLRQQLILSGSPDDSQTDILLKMVGLENTGDKKVRNFSLGMKQRLGIAVALAGNPDFIVLDEPINGLDPQGIVEIRELILKMNKEMGITILISSHILDELSKLATHYGFVDKGHVVKEMSAEELDQCSRKCQRVILDNISVFTRYLDGKNIEYSVISDREINVYSQLDVTEAILAVNKDNCHITSITERDETLESYFINLVGGADND